MLRKLSACSLCLWFASSLAHAQAAPAATAEVAPQVAATPPAQPGPAPDLVQLKSGGMVRGTISEYLPGDHVIIVTMGGESRRFEAADVSYAGPAEGAPPPASATPATATSVQPAEPPLTAVTTARPIVSVRARVARIHFGADPASDQPLTLFWRDGTATAYGAGGAAVAESFARVCTAPCDAEIAQGSYTLGIGLEDRPAAKVPEMVTIADGDSLVATYRSRRGVRVAGWLVWAGGLVLGTVIMTSSISADGGDDGGFIGGGAVLGVSTIAGLIMANLRDVAEIRKH